jgi:hypothetical protein
MYGTILSCATFSVAAAQFGVNLQTKMALVQSINKIRSYLSIVVEKYFLVDQSRALLEPAVYDENVTKNFISDYAKSGLEALRLALYVGAISDVKALLFDTGDKAASLSTLCDLLKNGHVVKALCKDLCDHNPKIRLYGEMSDEMKEVAEKSSNELRISNIQNHFDNELPRVLQEYEELKSSDLAERIIKARDKAIAHYEVKTVGNSRLPNKIQDFSLMWGDLADILSQSKQIIVDLCMIINLESYDLDSGININNHISKAFWKTES